MRPAGFAVPISGGTPPGGAAPRGRVDPYHGFYMQLFGAFDREKRGVLSGKQIFGFLITSGVPKAVLSQIWDEAKQGRKGETGLSPVQFMIVLKLISAAQRGAPPKMASIHSRPFPPPQMKYPPGYAPMTAASPHGARPPAAAEASATGPRAGVEAESGVAVDSGGDPFAFVSSSLGPLSAARVALSTGGSPAPGVVSLAAGSLSMPPLETATVVTATGPMKPTTPVGGSGGAVDGYGPKGYLLRQQSSRGVLLAEDMSAEDGSLLTRKASRVYYESEKMSEQLRASEKREKLAKSQANEARLENEKLSRENERLLRELNEAMSARSSALKQSQDALSALTPLRLENDKLKSAIEEWRVLIQGKDEEMEEMSAEILDLRQRTELFEQKLVGSEETERQLKFEVSKVQSQLEEVSERKRELQSAIDKLQTEALNFQSEKVQFELDAAKLSSELKKVNRELAKAQSAATRRSARRSPKLSSTSPPPPTSVPPTYVPPTDVSPLEDDMFSFGATSSSEPKAATDTDALSKPQTAVTALDDFRELDFNDFGFEQPPATGGGDSSSKAPSGSPPATGTVATASGGGDLFGDFDDLDFGSEALSEAKPSSMPAADNSEAIISGVPVVDSTHAADGSEDFEIDMDDSLADGSEDVEFPEFDADADDLSVSAPAPAPLSEEKSAEKVITETVTTETVTITEKVAATSEKAAGSGRRLVAFGDDWRSSPWYLSAEERTRYHAYFAQADLNGDGLIDGGEATKFFVKSKLHHSELAAIWNLVDTDKSGKLDTLQFFAMFHMVFKVALGKKAGRKGMDLIPKELPQCLTGDFLAKLGTMVPAKGGDDDETTEETPDDDNWDAEFGGAQVAAQPQTAQTGEGDDDWDAFGDDDFGF